MVSMNCLLWAYYMGVTDSYFAPFCYLFAIIIFMGMIDLAAQLSDPFGCDLTDFPMNDWVAEFLDSISGLMDHVDCSGRKEVKKCELEQVLTLNPDLILRLEQKHITEFLDADVSTMASLQSRGTASSSGPSALPVPSRSARGYSA